jgi:hypothetical protein
VILSFVNLLFRLKNKALRDDTQTIKQAVFDHLEGGKKLQLVNVKRNAGDLTPKKNTPRATNPLGTGMLRAPL